MKWLKENKSWFFMAATVVLAILLFRQCEKTNGLANQRNNANLFLTDTVSYYKNELGQRVATKAALKGDKYQLQILLSKQIDSTSQLKRLVKHFKEISAAGNLTQKTQIDTLRIHYRDSIPFQFARKWNKVNPYYSISGNSDQFGITIDGLSISNTLSFVIGDRKNGFFSTKYKIEAINSNPFVHTIGLDSYTLKTTKKRFGLGFSAGYGIGGVYIGIGLNYSLIQF